MTIQGFIEKAIGGGYEKPSRFEEGAFPEVVLLDPKAWRSVAKVEGWDRPITDEDRRLGLTLRRGYLVKMHMMIDALAEGKTIQQFLGDL